MSAGVGSAIDLKIWWQDEIFKMAKSVPVEERREYVWRVDPATWRLVRSLLAPDVNYLLWQPPRTADEQETLIGRPVEVTDEVQGLTYEVRR